MKVTSKLTSPPATFEALLQSAKEAEEAHQALEREWLNHEPDGGGVYRDGAPIDRIRASHRNADVAAGLVHKRIDAYLRGKCSLDGDRHRTLADLQNAVSNAINEHPVEPAIIENTCVHVAGCARQDCTHRCLDKRIT